MYFKNYFGFTPNNSYLRFSVHKKKTRRAPGVASIEVAIFLVWVMRDHVTLKGHDLGGAAVSLTNHWR